MSTDGFDRLKAASARFVGHVRDVVLPFWSARAWDGRRGGFHEALGHDGVPVAGLPRRVRVQFRQIHAFAEAHALGWAPEGDRLARQGFDFVLSHACPDDGARGCVHVLDEDGRVTDARRDLYDQAFLLLASASTLRILKDIRAALLAEMCLAFLDRELPSPSGGYLEDDRGALPRRQNPHMHLFEALIALFDATARREYRVRAEKVFELFKARFFDLGEGVVREYFTETLAAAPGPKGLTIEPGHMVEWAALLDRFQALSGAETGPMQQTLFTSATRRLDPGSGFLPDSLVLQSPVADRGARLWPQTEYLRAALALARHGDAKAAAAGAVLCERLLETYLNHRTPGLWIDRFDDAGAPAAENVPASILYHILAAARDADAYLKDTPVR